MTDRKLNSLEIARRLDDLAMEMAREFGPIDAMRLLVGAAVGMLEPEVGREKAARYLAELAAQTAKPNDTSALRQTRPSD